MPNSRLTIAEQISDLTASIEKLQLAIQQIDSQTKQLLWICWTKSISSLTSYLPKVWRRAKRSWLSDHTNDKDGSGKGWQSGLSLWRSRKAKNSRLALLSAGKTLTALSLIFAIFKQQPAPFCVLDEVDAPLDDANVARFTRLIEQLAKDVQFVFISHNKLAMQIADELKRRDHANGGCPSWSVWIWRRWKLIWHKRFSPVKYAKSQALTLSLVTVFSIADFMKSW